MKETVSMSKSLVAVGCLVALCSTILLAAPSSAITFDAAKINAAEMRGWSSGGLYDSSCTLIPASLCAIHGVGIIDGNVGNPNLSQARVVLIRCNNAEPSYNPGTGTSYNRCGEGSCIHVQGRLLDHGDSYQIDATKYWVLDPIYCQP
jgi:hypothetical protein